MTRCVLLGSFVWMHWRQEVQQIDIRISLAMQTDTAMSANVWTQFISCLQPLGSFTGVNQEKERNKQAQLCICHSSQWQAVTTAQSIYCWAQWGHPVCLNWPDHSHSLLNRPAPPTLLLKSCLTLTQMYIFEFLKCLCRACRLCRICKASEPSWLSSGKMVKFRY